jgi:hypothetical protein
MPQLAKVIPTLDSATMKCAYCRDCNGKELHGLGVASPALSSPRKLHAKKAGA